MADETIVKKMGDGTVDPEKLRLYFDDFGAQAKKRDDINSHVSERTSTFLESEGLDRKALGWGRQLFRMSPEKRYATLQGLSNIEHIMGWDQNPQGNMDFEEDAPRETAESTAPADTD